jgi:8-oxo-dGTP diphosphatase
MPHIHDKIDFTTSVYIVHKNKVLLRMHEKYKLWLGPGGHIELDEDPNQAVVREAKEEVGLDIVLFDLRSTDKVPDVYNADPSHHKELIPPLFLNRHFVSPTHEHVDLVYFATSESGAIKPAEGESTENIRWFSAEELKQSRGEFREDVAHYAEKALELLSL